VQGPLTDTHMHTTEHILCSRCVVQGPLKDTHVHTKEHIKYVKYIRLPGSKKIKSAAITIVNTPQVLHH